MSQQNESTIREAMKAFIGRDAEAFAACFTEDADLMLPRNFLEGGGYRGREGARQAIADTFDTWDDVGMRLESIREIGDQVLVVVRVTNVGKPGTPTIEYVGAHVVRLRDGKIVHWRPYQSQREALEAIGVSE